MIGWTPPGHEADVPVPVELLEDGACRSSRPTSRKDPWFPPTSYGKVPPISAVRAKQKTWDEWCSECPVLLKCLGHAVENEVYGIWAGTTDFDRRQIRKDPELREYATSRAAAGYVPLPLPTCVVGTCSRVVAQPGTVCGHHRTAIARAERKG